MTCTFSLAMMGGPSGGDPLLWASELIVHTSSVGEALTVPMLRLSRRVAGSALIEAALTAIAGDESSHAQLGWWFLGWAEPHPRGGRRAGRAARPGGGVRPW